MLDHASRLRVNAIADVWREAEAGWDVQDSEVRDVSVVTPGALERLVFSLLLALRAEQTRSIADKLVAVDDAAVARIVDDAHVRLWCLFLFR
jgi:hypothetical protein